MREIKFRAWDNDQHRFLNLLSIEFIDTAPISIVYSGSQQGNNFVKKIKDDCGFTDILLLQFTGLKDKNGKEIYEGDIMKVMLNTQQWGKGNKSKDFNCQVVWNQHLAGFDLKEPKNTGRYNVRNGGLEHCEVVGNIYEHPELLSQPATT